MDRVELLELWNDMWQDGNWIPSMKDALRDVSAEQAAWHPSEGDHSIWEEVAHITFWRRATIDGRAAGESDADTERLEFAADASGSAEAWDDALAELERTQVEVERMLGDDERSVERIRYHLIHDAYHLGRITQLRAMMGPTPSV